MLITPQQIKDKCAEYGITLLYDPAQNPYKIEMQYKIVDDNEDHMLLILYNERQRVMMSKRTFDDYRKQSDVLGCLVGHSQQMSIGLTTTLFSIGTFLKDMMEGAECGICNEEIDGDIYSCVRCTFSCCLNCRHKCIEIATTVGHFKCPGCRERWIELV